MDLGLRELTRALRRRFPSLSPEDAAQYAAESLVAAPLASADEQVAAARRRIRADGYDDPVVGVAQDLDEDAAREDWLARRSDEGAGQANIEARVGLARPSRRRRSIRRLRRALVQAAIALSREATPVEREILAGRVLRPLLGDGQVTPFRRLSRPGLSLGWTVAVERRLWRRLRDLAEARRAQAPPEQGRLWE